MKKVKVKFDCAGFNYVTSVSPFMSDKDIHDYFVGTSFNMGQYPREDFQECTGVEIKES